MKHAKLVKAEQLSMQQRLCRLELSGSPCASSRAVLCLRKCSCIDCCIASRRLPWV